MDANMTQCMVSEFIRNESNAPVKSYGWSELKGNAPPHSRCQSHSTVLQTTTPADTHPTNGLTANTHLKQTPLQTAHRAPFAAPAAF